MIYTAKCIICVLFYTTLIKHIMKKNFPCGLKNKYIQKFDELYRRLSCKNGSTWNYIKFDNHEHITTHTQYK